MSSPKTRFQAIPVLVTLTEQCEALAKRIRTSGSRKALNANVARFREVNDVRCRIVEQFNLHHFAAGLLGNGNNN